MADNKQNDTLGEWWGVAKTVAYELRPFTLPTYQDLENTAQATRTNVEQLWIALKELAPGLADAVRSVNLAKLMMVFTWLCGWAGFIWLEFGAVYFIVSAMVMIFTNLGERDESEWSAYSVFNAGCRALLGTLNAEQFEREIMRQNVAAPDHHHHHRNQNDVNDANGVNDAQQEDEYVWVEPAPGAAANADDESDSDEEEEFDGGGGGGGGGAGGGAGAGRAGGRRVSGKRARRGFEERRERREERRLALLALGPDAWE